MTNQILSKGQEINIGSMSLKLGVDRVGVCSLRDFEKTKLHESAHRLLPVARSIVVLAMGVYPEPLELSRAGRQAGAASLNELLDRHMDFINSRLTRAAYDITKVCHNQGFKALPLPAAGCPVDTRFLEAVFSYKHAGQAAGLGYIGQSSLLVTPDFGPRVLLSCCLTEADIQLNRDLSSSNIVCTECQICIDNCPASALRRPQSGEPYAINKSACSLFRNASGGCSECMRLCPAGGSSVARAK